MLSWLDALGIDLGTWALLLVIAWYIFRGARAGKRAGSVLGRVVTYVVLILVTGAIAAALGWADLNIGAFLADAGAAVEWLLDEGVRWLSDLLPEVSI